MKPNASELEKFEKRTLPTLAQWTAAADAFVAHRSLRTLRRLGNDDSDLDTDTDDDDGYIPTLCAPAPVPVPAMSTPVTSTVRSDRQPPRTRAAPPTRPSRYFVIPDDDDDNDHDDVDEAFAASTRATPTPTPGAGHHKYRFKGAPGPNIVNGGFINPKEQINIRGITDISSHTTFRSSPVRRRPGPSPISLITPPRFPKRKSSAALAALYNFDLPSPECAPIRLLVREIGEIVLKPGTSLADAVKQVGGRVSSVLGPAAGEVAGLRDAQGVVSDAKWRRGAGGEQWRVAIEWAW